MEQITDRTTDIRNNTGVERTMRYYFILVYLFNVGCLHLCTFDARY